MEDVQKNGLVNSTPIVEINDLTVRYGLKMAVDHLNLSLEEGQSVGLLGANGAGKTSTLSSLMGMIRPSSGKVTVLGFPAGNTQCFRDIGYAPEVAIPPEFLTGKEYLQMMGRLRGLEGESEIDELLKWFELDPAQRIGQYSKGMKRRIVLGQALLGKPKLLVLDEPLSGLDPIMITRLREKLEELKKSRCTLLFSSHILAEVEKVCSHVAMIHQGKLCRHAAVPELVSEFGSIENAFSATVSANSLNQGEKS